MKLKKGLFDIIIDDKLWKVIRHQINLNIFDEKTFFFVVIRKIKKYLICKDRKKDKLLFYLISN